MSILLILQPGTLKIFQNNNTIEYVKDIAEASNLDLIALQEIADLNEFNELSDNLQGWQGFRYSDSDYGEFAFLINLENIQILESPYSILNQHNHYFCLYTTLFN